MLKILVYMAVDCTSQGGMDFGFANVAPQGVLLVAAAGNVEFLKGATPELDQAAPTSDCAWVVTHDPFQ